MHTQDMAEANIEKIGQLFPNCLTERINENGKPEMAIDFDKLKQELSKEVVEGNQERYQFTWPGKREAMRLANTPSNMTLRPERESSVDFDNTENLYIEGDNLEVLKLLRENYLGKVKMIYIDPPYNTGNDFVYEDDFSQTSGEFMDKSGMFDSYGNMTLDRYTVNSENNGRFHTDWLNMIYPRIKVSRDLLNDHGVIFISIDENEVENLKRICNEIYGADNRLGIIANINNPKGRSDDKFIATSHEYILVYAKNKSNTEWFGFEPTEEIIKRYNKTDSDGRKYREIDLRKTGENDLREDRPNLFYYFYYNENTGDFFPSRDNLTKDGYLQIRPLREDGMEGNWRWGLDTAEKQINDLTPKFMPTRKVWGIMQKDYLDGRSLVKPTSTWTYKDVNSERGTEEFIDLGFDKRIFPKPKPLGTISRCVKLATSAKQNDIVLDFFSGSATTAHAVMRLNADDDGNRKYILVQLQEKTEENSVANKAGFLNICQIGEERIRRSSKKIKQILTRSFEDTGLFENNRIPSKIDIGFRVLKLDTSNLLDVFYKPESFSESNLFEDNVKSDRSSEDLLFQVMLECNLPLSAKIERKTIAGKEVFNVNEGYLLACFDEDVNEIVITEVAKQKPYYFIMRDKSLSSDNVADNFEQIFNAYSKDTIRRIL